MRSTARELFTEQTREFYQDDGVRSGIDNENTILSEQVRRIAVVHDLLAAIDQRPIGCELSSVGSAHSSPVGPKISVVVVERLDDSLTRHSTTGKQKARSLRLKGRQDHAIADLHPKAAATQAVDQHHVVIGRAIAAMTQGTWHAGIEHDNERYPAEHAPHHSDTTLHGPGRSATA